MYEVKVFVVQREDGEIVGAKLTRGAAQSVARYFAPAKVTPMIANKEGFHLDARADQDGAPQ